MKHKEAILLITFGTSYESARKSFEHINEMVQKRWPEKTIYWGYTSTIIRKKLRRQGIITDSPIAAMSRMRDEGITSVVIQSLHVIAGEEYNDLKDCVAAFQSTKYAFDRVRIGRPLLGAAEDIPTVLKAFIQEISKYREKDQKLVLMGHGTRHPADITYLAAAAELRKQDSNAYLGTVEGHPRFEDVLEELRRVQAKNVLVMPFMTVAGDHATNDMAGEDEVSWKSQLEAEGIECKCLMQGMGQLDSIVSIWLDHLEEAMNQ